MPPSDSDVEKYVDKVLDEIFTQEIEIIAKFSEKFENIAKDMHISARWMPACLPYCYQENCQKGLH